MYLRPYSLHNILACNGGDGRWREHGRAANIVRMATISKPNNLKHLEARPAQCFPRSITDGEGERSVKAALFKPDTSPTFSTEAMRG